MGDRRPFRALILVAVVACLGAGPTATARPGPVDSPQELFARAEALYRQLEAVDPAVQSTAWGNVAGAFDEVRSRYPDDPLAGEALWRLAWIYGQRAAAGHSSAAEQEFAAYRDLVGSHPDSPHAPEALVRLAVRAERNDGPEAARLYARLLQRYPSTPQASLARNRLRDDPGLARAADTAAVADGEPPAGAGDAAPGTTADADGGPGPEPDDVAGGEPVATGSGAAVPGDDRDAAPVDDGAPAAAGALDEPADVGILQGVRHYSDATHTRVVLDLDRPVDYEAGLAQDPARLFLDLQGVAVAGALDGARAEGREQLIRVDGSVDTVRVGANQPGVTRVVLDLRGDGQHTLFTLDREGMPFRIVVDVPSPAVAARVNSARRPELTETASSTSVARQLGLGVQRIVIDPGHGGQHPGAIGRTGVTEKQITLDLAGRLAARLRERGYEVLLTRDDDRTVDLEERTRIANEAGADLFVSLHVNAARSRNLQGFETYYLNLATDPTAASVAARENASGETQLADLGGYLEKIVQNDFLHESRQLAASVQDNLVMQVSKGYDGIRDLGVKSAPFVVLVGARMPAILVEASFISNETEESRLRTDQYRDRVVEAIDIGIQSYVERRLTTSRPGR